MALSLESQNPLTEERYSMFFKRTDQIQNFKSLKSSFIQNLLSLIIIRIIIAIIIFVYYQIVMANQYSNDAYNFYYKMAIFYTLNIFYDSNFLNDYANSYALNIIAIIFLIISVNHQDCILYIYRYCIR